MIDGPGVVTTSRDIELEVDQSIVPAGIAFRAIRARHGSSPEMNCAFVKVTIEEGWYKIAYRYMRLGKAVQMRFCCSGQQKALLTVSMPVSSLGGPSGIWCVSRVS